MKKALIVIIAIVSCVTAQVATAAVATVKKAAPVATKSSSSSNTTSSLAGTALQFGLNVAQLSKQQKEMTAECIPSSAEITFVNNTIKEWAKTGAMTADEVENKLSRRRCEGGTGYESDVIENATTKLNDICYDNFALDSERENVWYGFPKVGLATYCSDGSYSCKNKKTQSDIYEIFNLIDFSEADYTKQEATMAAKLISKIENCSNAKLSQKKRAMWGEFLTTTIGGVGQKTSTSSIMETVGTITKSGTNLSGGLSSLGTIATQVLSK